MAVNQPMAPSSGGHERQHQMESSSVVSSASHMSMTETIATGIKTSLSHWKIIMFGQVMAMLMGARGSSNALLYLKCDVMAPTFQMGLVYAILSLHLLHLYRSQSMDQSRVQRAKEQSDMWADDKSSVAGTPSHPKSRAATQRKPASPNTATEGASQTSIQPPPAPPIVDISMLFSGVGSPSQESEEDVATMTGQYRLPLIRSSLILNAPWHKYFWIALLDVEGNFFTYVALKYTSIKSVALLDTLAIPAAMVSSYMVLKRRYSPAHLFGVAVCLLGASMMVFSDYEEAEEEAELDGSESGSSVSDAAAQYAMIGDILAGLGGICFGIKDTLSEEVLKASKESNGDNVPSKNAAQTEFLGMLGFYGLIISAVQVLLLERHLVHELFTSSTCPPSATFGMIFCIVFIFVAFYVGMARFLHMSEAALLNLNLLTSDLYAVLFSIVEEHTLPTHLFIVSMILILSGVLVYESVPPPREDVHRQHRPSAYGVRAYNNTDKSSGGGSHDLELNQVEMTKRTGTTTAATTAPGGTASHISPSSFQLT